MSLGIIFLVIFIALAFEYINGFHDTANSIATIVGTKVMTPRQAIAMAAITNLIGALAGHAVAKTVSSGLVDAQSMSPMVIVCALIGGIVWNLLTWWFGMPSSSTHALVGGICGAAVANTGTWHSIIWSVEKIKDGKVVMEGVLHKVVVPMITSPLIGFVGGFLFMGLLYFQLRNARPRFVSRVFGKAQIVSASYMGFAHGLADAQKTMGVITLALVSATAAGSFHELPESLHFLRMGKSELATQSVQTIQDPHASATDLRSAAEMLDRQSEHESSDDLREAFQVLASRTFASLGDNDAAENSASKAVAIHRTVIAEEEARWLPDIPLLGGMLAVKHSDWSTTLDQEMGAAVTAKQAPLPAAAARVAGISPDVPVWIKIICSLTMAAGTMSGGWRIIKTLGHKMVKLQPVHGFAAETTAATVLAITGGLGMTVSTTHCITTSIMGVGCAKRFGALKLSLIERILWAWVLTLPAAGIVSYLTVKLFRMFGWLP